MGTLNEHASLPPALTSRCQDAAEDDQPEATRYGEQPKHDALATLTPPRASSRFFSAAFVSC